jgi:hypothetical protein
MPYSRSSSFLGIAKQPTAGVPAAATGFIVLAGDPHPVDAIAEITDRGWRGSAVDAYGSNQGQRRSALALAGNLDLGSIGYALQGVLPDLAVTGSGPFTTVFSSKNTGGTQSQPYTLSDYTGLETRQYSDQKVEELTISFAPMALVIFAAKTQGWASAPAGANPVPSFSAVPPLAAYLGAVTIGGTPATNVLSGELTIKRPITLHPSMNGGQDPAEVWQGPVTVTGKMAFVYESNLELARYLTDSKVSLDVKVTQGASSLTLHSTLTSFDTAAVTRQGEWVEVATTFACLGNTTDAGATGGSSPIKATLVNSTPAGTYA